MDITEAQRVLHAASTELLRLDQRALRRQLDRFRGRDPGAGGWTAWLAQLAAARSRQIRRVDQVPAVTVDAQLPIAAHADDLVALIRRHQVLVVAGETGSGKSTQLPKLCLAAGRGRHGLIGCTQPRRIAAKSVAKRVADELASPIGGLVGWQVRFTDQVGDNALIKFMTDGILLAETPSDRLLDRYDTLIIDEAHERSLNIDFLLGYLKDLLPRRPDLKLIITSATIDTTRFAQHFCNAPVVSVEGRGFPVEVRYRPLAGDEEDRKDRALYQGIATAIAELSRHDPLGDILVFLPGEREIRDAHQFLTRQGLKHTEVLALYARLSVAEQDRVFAPGGARRIVLATNVAETSITVPRVRFVIDAGNARIARYSPRIKVQRLHIEPVSQAAANQRAGRCGRTAPGICIRLYDEADFQVRPAYTDPEIHRSSLAGVILRMAKLKLGDPLRFPFLDPPDSRMVGDGWQLLEELGAVDQQHQLTPIGRTMAELPVDVRLARLLVAGRDLDCLAEMLVLASGLAIADPRERPHDARQAADAAHAVFADERSDFVALLNLWQAYEQQHEALSQGKLRDWSRQHFLSYLRLREWRELHRQLKLKVQELGWKQNVQPASYEVLHQTLLRAYITQLGERDEKGFYRSTRGKSFQVFPASTLAKSKQKWLLAATLLDTEKLWALTCARIDPAWIEPAATHLAKSRHYDPHWDEANGRAVCFEDVNLLGLQIVSKRRVALEAIDAKQARELFLRHALLRGELKVQHQLYAHNARMRVLAREREEKSRRRGLLKSEDELLPWFDARVPPGIASVNALTRLLGRGGSTLETALRLSVEDLLKPDVRDPDRDFPRQWHIEQLKLPLAYRFEPGAIDDGVTVDVQLEQLGRLDPSALEWLVPGLRAEKAAGLIKSLPKQLRRNFVPAPDFAQAFLEAHPQVPAGLGLADALAAFLSRVTGVAVGSGDFDVAELATHLRLNIRLFDEHRKLLAQGRDLGALLQQFGARAQAAFAERAQGDYKRDGLRAWPELLLPPEIRQRDGSRAYPALVDQGNAVGVRVFALAEEAASAHRAGVLALLRIDLSEEIRYWRKQLPLSKRAELNFSVLGAAEQLRIDTVDALFEELSSPLLDVRDRDSFLAACVRVRRELGSALRERAALLEPVLIAYGELKQRLKPPLMGFASGNLDDARAQLDRLVHPGFTRHLPQAQLKHYPRYLKALGQRLDGMLKDPARDQARMLEVQALERQFGQRVDTLGPERRQQVLYLLQELRVSLFAQTLGTAESVSPKRIARLLEG